MAQSLEQVAVLGIGAMGHGMATSALRAGIPTIVWNRAPAATQDLAELGAEVAGTAADAARRAGIVVTMVTDVDAVVSIARDQGMLAALAPEAIWGPSEAPPIAAPTTGRLLGLPHVLLPCRNLAISALACRLAVIIRFVQRRAVSSYGDSKKKRPVLNSDVKSGRFASGGAALFSAQFPVLAQHILHGVRHR